MKVIWKFFWGIGLILLAVLLILNEVGVFEPLNTLLAEVSVFSLVCGLFLVAYILSRLLRGQIKDIFFPLAFLFMLFESNIAKLCNLEKSDIINNWILLVIAFLLWMGFSVLFSQTRVKSYKKSHTHTKRTSTENNLSSATIYVDSAEITPNHIENNLGSCKVMFENIDQYKGNGALYVENSLGHMTIYVPSAWQAVCEIDNSLSAHSVQSAPNPNAPILNLYVENSLGYVSIVYV